MNVIIQAMTSLSFFHNTLILCNYKLQIPLILKRTPAYTFSTTNIYFNNLFYSFYFAHYTHNCHNWGWDSFFTVNLGQTTNIDLHFVKMKCDSHSQKFLQALFRKQPKISQPTHLPSLTGRLMTLISASLQGGSNRQPCQYLLWNALQTSVIKTRASSAFWANLFIPLLHIWHLFLVSWLKLSYSWVQMAKYLPFYGKLLNPGV